MSVAATGIQAIKSVQSLFSIKSEPVVFKVQTINLKSVLHWKSTGKSVLESLEVKMAATDKIILWTQVDIRQIIQKRIRHLHEYE